MKNNKISAIGVMSGTSLDGIDISLILSDGKNSFYHKYSALYDFRVITKNSLIKIINNFTQNKKSFAHIMKCEKLVTEDYLTAIKKFIKYYNIKKLDLVAIHGQTIFHSAKIKSSIQLCDSKYIRKKINKLVISDFRQKDLFNKGQGAPLVPIFHKLLIDKLKLKKPCCFINIGGISNITLLNKNNKLIAYDVGPGMCLLDRYVFLFKKINYDKNGNFSLKGKTNNKVLNDLKKDLYFKRKFPKSLDRNYFSINSVLKLDFYDACATLSAFTAYSIIDELNKFEIKNIVLSGGGIRNKFILNLLKESFGDRLVSIDEKYGNSKFIESQAFAYLGIRRVKNLPISFPSTTGVRTPVTGGKIA
tara:strand:+ start:630 stop:1712 length:1083 start_codon:yes stop_codon:yes gene_type:complete